MIGQNVMDTLQHHIGKNVFVLYSRYGGTERETGVLKVVEPFKRVEVGNCSIPFVGYGSAIRLIWCSDTSELLYQNGAIPDNYDARDQKEMGRYIFLSFGAEVVREQSEAHRAMESEWEQHDAELYEKWRKKAPRIMQRGAELVKPEMVDTWKRFVATRKDAYSLATLEIAVAMMEVLSKHTWSSPKRALKAADEFDSTGNMYAKAVHIVVEAHPMGEKMRRYWNKLNGVDKKAEGTANPAILVLSDEI